MPQNVGSHLDKKVLDHFLTRNELLPELEGANLDLLEELLDSQGFPPELNAMLRERIENF